MIRTDPAAGTPGRSGDPTVTMTVSNAITMPDVRGQNVDEAGGAADQRRALRPGHVVLRDRVNTVQSQDPAPGTRVEPGSTVSLNSFG